MPRILFVDDEPNVLGGLRRMLHGTPDWQMEFATTAEQALARLRETSFDVVVSDMRMPGTDGAQLLAEVMRQHPQTVRMILSGQSDREGVFKSVGPTHQFLAKPCEPETLKNAIQRACSLRARLRNENLHRLVSQVTSLPSVPAIYNQIVATLETPDVPLRHIGEIIARDVAMTAKVLQLVNSAFFCLPRRISSPEHAVSLLGADTVRALVLSAGIFAQFEGKAVPPSMLEGLNRHSLQVGAAAKALAAAEVTDKQIADDSLLAGLLHDVGILVLLAHFGGSYVELLRRSQTERRPLADVEQASLGATHADVGAYLLGLWGLKDAIVEAVALHHCPSDRIGRDFSPTAAVHVADCVAHENEQTVDPGSTFSHDYLASLQGQHPADQWSETCRLALAQA